MDLAGANLVLRTLFRDLPNAVGHLSEIEKNIRSIRDSANQIMGAGINPASMRELSGLTNQMLEDLDRVRARLIATSKTIEQNIV